ncbi:MAG TPA: phosphohistidine phosphatase SixA [Vulgatibacter sp.]|nr:phosphohistidine phosphatase SixA [Vulgatibacter sp.]
MRVYLIRHGEAADPAHHDRDEERPLTAPGRARVRRSAAAWAASGEPAPELWIVSPYVRAVQTAEIFAAVFGSEAPIAIWRGLVPDARVSETIERVEAEAPACVALVGHQPLMGGIAAFLLGWSRVPAQVKPGAILAIDRDDEGAGLLAWHMPPPAEGDEPRILRSPRGG